VDQDCFRQIDLLGVAVSAAINGDGKLTPVGQLFPKLLSAIREERFPRVHTVVVASGQSLDGLGLCQDQQRPNWHWHPQDDFLVIRAANLEDMATELVICQQTRWTNIDTLLPPRKSDFVGRRRLFQAIESFIAGHDSGYLVLVGAMGRGKTTFMVELIHRALEAAAVGKTCPAYHIIDSQRSITEDPDYLVKNLYNQLRRQYLFREPEDWGTRTSAMKLQELLSWLSRSKLGQGEKLVLYIDAADQAQAGPTTPLLRGVLRPLPPGVLGIISSRTRLDWLSSDPSITVWDLKDYLNDREDVAEYLGLTARQYGLGLNAEFNQKIISQPDPPVFFTVAARLRQLLDSKTAEEERKRLCEEVALWVMEPEELVNAEADRVVREAAAKGISQDIVWGSLGLLALARETLSEDQLRQMGLWQHETMSTVFGLARNFFGFRPINAPRNQAYVFGHPGYQRKIATQLGESGCIECHRLLAQACNCWRDLRTDLINYALKHRMWHWSQAKQWESFAICLADADFIVARSEQFDFADVYSDVLAVTKITDLPTPWQDSFSQLEHFLRFRIERLRSFPATYAQEIVNEFLPVASKNLIVTMGSIEDKATGRNHVYLRKQYGQTAIIVGSHHGEIYCVVSSPDRCYVATGSGDQTVKIWDAFSGALIADCIGHTSEVICVAYSPDGQFVASGSSDCTMRIWDARSGALVADCQGHTDCITSVAYSPDGRFLASGSRDCTMRIWDAHSGALVASCLEHRNTIPSVVYSPDGRLVVSGSMDHTVKIWDAHSGRMVADCRKHKGWVNSVTYSPDGRFVASASKDHTVKIWDASSGALVANCKGHKASVNSVAYSPDGLFVASGSDDGTVKIWDARLGTLVADCQGHTTAVESVSYFPDGRFVASGDLSSTMKIWDARSGVLVADREGHTHSLEPAAYSPDGRFTASGTWDGTMKIWDTHSHMMVVDRRRHTDWITTPAYSPDGHFIASGCMDYTVKIWDAHLRKLVANCHGHSALVTSVAYSPDGRFVVSGSDDFTVKIWDARSGAIVASCKGHKASVNSVAYSPDGHFVASGSDDGTVKIWDARLGTLVADCQGHTDSVGSVAYSPDGRFVASGSNDRTVKIWNAHSGALVVNCPGHTDNVWIVEYSMDGRFVASGSRDGTLKIWDAYSGVLTADCQGHINYVTHVKYSPDGRCVASGSGNGSVKIWDPRNGALVANCQGHKDRIWVQSFSPDARFLATGSDDCTVRIWKVTPKVAQCVSILFFEYDPLTVQWIGPPSSRSRQMLLVADAAGHFYGYEVC
jgi:WD40 repeat protein